MLDAWDKVTNNAGEDFAFERKHMAKLVRGINENEGLWDNNDFGPYVKAQFELLCGSTERTAVGSKAQFVAWYPPFDAWVKAQIEEREAAWEAEKQAKAAGAGG